MLAALEQVKSGAPEFFHFADLVDSLLLGPSVGPCPSVYHQSILEPFHAFFPYHRKLPKGLPPLSTFLCHAFEGGNI